MTNFTWIKFKAKRLTGEEVIINFRDCGRDYSYVNCISPSIDKYMGIFHVDGKYIYSKIYFDKTKPHIDDFYNLRFINDTIIMLKKGYDIRNMEIIEKEKMK